MTQAVFYADVLIVSQEKRSQQDVEIWWKKEMEHEKNKFIL